MDAVYDRIERAAGGIAGAVLVSLIGLCAFALALAAAGGSRRILVAGVGMAGMLALTLLTRRVKEILLFGWIFSLTYNRQYFIFVPLVGDQGSQGPYIIASDLFLGMLFAWWFYEHTILRKKFPPLGPRLWPWYLPFAAVCVLTTLQADRPDWAFYELVRVAKVGLVLFYARHNFGKREWWVCLGAFGCAMAAQAGLGTLEVLTKRSGALGVFGLGAQQATVTERFEGEFSQEFWYGRYRATATMSHPPNLACYLLLVIPVFLAFGLTAPRRWLRLASAGAGLLGLVGLACTYSRFPWALSVLQLSILLPGLTLLRLVPVKQFLALFIFGTLAAGAALYPVRHIIRDRFSSDLKVSSEGRVEEVTAGLQLWSDYPLAGIGLNNSILHFVRYRPEIQYNVELDSELTQVLKLRAIVSPQNGFVHVLMEVGIIGFLAYLVYVLGVFSCALRAVALHQGYKRAICFGLLVGLLGVKLQQLIDFSYWVDPVLYSFTIVVGMLCTAGVLKDNQPAGETAPAAARV